MNEIMELEAKIAKYHDMRERCNKMLDAIKELVEHRQAVRECQNLAKILNKQGVL